VYFATLFRFRYDLKFIYFLGIEYQVKVSIGCHGSLLCNYFIMLDVNWFDGSEK